MRILLLFVGAFFYTVTGSKAQIPDSCKLKFGTNLAGFSDYMTELPFVNLMHNAREWYTKDLNDPTVWDSEYGHRLEVLSNGYPTHAPQSIDGGQHLPATVWAVTDGWPEGDYTLLYDGNGELDFWGTHDSVTDGGDHRMIVHFSDTHQGILELIIQYSDANDPIQNIKLLMPGSEQTHLSDPYYSLWKDRLDPFPTLRFMDWGHTNNWGEGPGYQFDDPTLFEWEDRAQADHYTYSTGKGVPYEVMIQTMNDLEKDGWVCIPHRASNTYIRQMAELFRDHLHPERKLYVEYSNEIWNWIFDQTHWLNKYGCEMRSLPWPEGLVSYVQNHLNIWSEVFKGQEDRLVRVVGIFTGWQDVSSRIVNHLDRSTFDAIAPTFYFSFGEQGERELDLLGAHATVSDIARVTRDNMSESLDYIRQNIDSIAKPLDVPMVFYEGGQHLTPEPFGEVPSYAQALLDIQRDEEMYRLYNEWFDMLRSLQTGNEPLNLMHFTMTASRSAEYGSWGMLETLDQDTTIVPAPKYKAILENQQRCSPITSSSNPLAALATVRAFPNPCLETLWFYSEEDTDTLVIYDLMGRPKIIDHPHSKTFKIDIHQLPKGQYLAKLQFKHLSKILKIIKQ